MKFEAKEYTFSELLEALRKESLETKPVIGTNVQKDNSRNNEKAVNDIIKQTEDYNDVKEIKRNTNPQSEKDFNKTTLDVRFAYPPSNEYEDRVKSLARGFTSTENEKTSSAKDNPSLSFEGNKEFLDADLKKQKEMASQDDDEKKSGLKTHNRKNYNNKQTYIGENIKNMKSLKYSKNILNETELLKIFPDSYRENGKDYKITDASGRTFFVECREDKVVKGYIHTNVVNMVDPSVINEQLNRMKELSGYNSRGYITNTNRETRKHETEMFSENINKVKDLMNKLDKNKK